MRDIRKYNYLVQYLVEIYNKEGGGVIVIVLVEVSSQKHIRSHTFSPENMETCIGRRSIDCLTN